MARWILQVSFVATLAAPAPLAGQAHATHAAVEMKGVKPTMKFEAAVEGFLKLLNGKLKQRATEIEFEPAGALGDHYHVGPGIRLVLAGELTLVHAESGAEQRVRAGEYFYEAGDKIFRVLNRGAQPARLLVVELLPAEWQGSAAVPLSRRADLVEQGRNLERRLCRRK